MFVTKTIFYVLASASLVTAKPGSLRNKSKAFDTVQIEERELDCTLVLTETQFESNQIQFESNQVQFESNIQEEEHWECEVDSSSDSSARGHFLALNLEYTVDYKDPVIGLIKSGATTFHADSAVLSESKAIIRGAPKLAQKTFEHNRRLSTTGHRSVLVVRVEANDASTSANEADLARKVFGLGDSSGETDLFNLSSGFAQCSYDKLTFGPANDSVGTNGVYSVSIGSAVVGQTFGSVRNVVLDKLRTDFGNNDLNALYDHIMICMPPGTVTNQGYTNWSAYAIINGYVSMFNNNWCMSPSSQMHEIGHNLGLRHSNEAGSTYEDKSGMMGHSFLSYESPYMCFNTAKNWQLGWYEDKHTTVNPLNDVFWQGQLIGYVDYMNSSAPSSAAVVVKVEGHNLDYFIGFNVKTGINRQNQESEAANKVTVHSVGTPGGESSLVAKLGAGNTFEITNFGGGLQSAIIQVQNIDMNSNPPVAQVSVNYVQCASDYDCDDGDMCTTNTCNISAGVCNHAPNALCSTGLMRTEVLTDKYPQETSWKIVDNCNNDAEVMSGSGYNTKFDTYTDSSNLPHSQYTVEVKDVYGDGICCGQGIGAIKVFYNDEEIKSFGKFGKSETYTWGSCLSTDSSPGPTASPIKAPTASPTKSPTASPTKAPTDSPTKAPTAAPSSCDMKYEISFETSSSYSHSASWAFAYDGNTSIVAGISSQAYNAGSTYSEIGCLKSNCYNFSINNAANYNLKIDGIAVANSDVLVGNQVSLFGTCEEIQE